MHFRRYVWPVALFAACSSGVFLGSGDYAHSDMEKYAALLSLHERAPSQIVLRLNTGGMHALETLNLNSLLGAQHFKLAEVKAFETSHSYFLVKLADDRDAAAYLDFANKDPNIAFAEPNYLYHLATAHKFTSPQTSNSSQQWALENLGQSDAFGTPGIAGADIGAKKAWQITTGSKSVLVAVIDTGIDYTHPDLAANIYRNPGESGNGKETNGIDDDGDGFVDDIHGWNFAGQSSNNTMDDQGHGTHVAGTIGANGNNGQGVYGVAQNVSLLPIKFLASNGIGTLADAVKSIQYATLMNAKIISNSWDGGAFSQSLLDAITAAQKKGILFVAAAGNGADNSDNSPHYPADYALDNIISVSASTNRDTLADFSTYGIKSVEIAAPGNYILSTVPNASYDTFSGSSEAVPFVAGAAALVASSDSSLGYSAIKDRLLRSRDFLPGMVRRIQSGGRLNVYNALAGIFPSANIPVETDWKDFPMQQALESAHPYQENSKLNWTISAPAGTKFMRVHFSKVDLELNCDFVKIFDREGEEMDSLTGSAVNLNSYFVPGNSITVQLQSDLSQNNWGFAVDKVQIVP